MQKKFLRTFSVLLTCCFSVFAGPELRAMAVSVSHEDIKDGMFTKRKITVDWNSSTDPIDDSAKNSVKEKICLYGTTCHFCNYPAESIALVRNFVLELAEYPIPIGVTFDPPQAELKEEFNKLQFEFDRLRALRAQNSFDDGDDAFFEAYPDTRSKKEKKRDKVIHEYGKRNNLIKKDDGSDQSD